MSPTAILTAFTHCLDKFPRYATIKHVEACSSTISDFGRRHDLVSFFRHQVFTRPTSIAVKDDQYTLTYSDLEIWSNVFCEAIVSTLGHYKHEAVVATCFPRSAILLVSVLALAKAGLAYVTLDPDQTSRYLHQQIEESNALLVLSSSSLIHIYAALAPNKVLTVDKFISQARARTQSSILLFPTTSVPTIPDGDALLTILFTSGTTGRPKGVMIEHRAMINAVNGELSALQPGDRVAITANPAFDAWSLFVWEALCHGATAVLYTSHLADLDAFTEFVTNECINKAFLPTAAFARLVHEPSLLFTLSRTLRRLVVAGERLSPEVVRAFARVRSQIELINAYGPSEAAVLTTFHKVDLSLDVVDGWEIPIGRPIANISIHILDDDLRSLPAGATGEICIGGSSLARGYLNQRKLTMEQFPTIANAKGSVMRVYRTGDLGRLVLQADGSSVLYYEGRRDNQIKVRGQRIEPSQIESVLLQQQVPGIVFGAQAAVVLTEGDQLIAYVVGKAGESSAKDDAERIRENWNTFGNDSENYADVNTSIIGADFANWNSMYDNTPIPREHMVEWLEDTLKSIPAQPNDSVLEVGCGTGMILFHVAPQCRDYTGIDISQPSIDLIRSQLQSRGLDQSVALCHGEASQLPETLPIDKRFSLIIMNSVIQYFGSRTYLEDVVNFCLGRVDDGGRIFFGDVRSYGLMSHHDLASILHCHSTSISTALIPQELDQLANSQSELFINPSFFFGLAKNANGRIRHVEIIPKEMSVVNELSQFRYQVVLHIGDLPFTPLKPSTWSTYDCPEVLREMLVTQETVAVRGIPNKAVIALEEALELLDSRDTPADSAALTNSAAASLRYATALLPSDLRRLAECHGHRVDISWGAHSSDCTLSAVFTRNADNIFKADFDTILDSQSEPTNTPKIRRTHSATPTEVGVKLREACQSQLPTYMVPAHVIVLDELPHTPNGKVDRRKLSHPDTWRPYVPSEGVIIPPRTQVEQQIVDVLSEVLAIVHSKISIDADLFSLGLHSFSAAKVVARLSEQFKIPKFPIKFIYDSPTVIALARLFDSSNGQAAANSLNYGEDFENLCKALPTKFPPNSPSKSRWTFFLTGATGFTGLFILRDLILRHKHDVEKVICLVRGSSRVECTQRLFANAAGYGIDTSGWLIEGPESNLEIIQGDLGSDQYGLDDCTWNRMTEEVDIILANGALVNLALDYSSVRAPNVGGCLTAIKMATTTCLKGLTFVSSMGVYNTPAYKARTSTNIPMLEDDDLEEARTDLTIGYLQSKWVSEKLIMRMASLGMPCNIVRPCHISGESRSGMVSNDDYFWRYTLGFMDMGLFPNKSTSITWVTVNYTSAVCIAAAVAAITGSSQRHKEVVYNVVPSHTMSWSQYFDALQSYGYDLKLVSVADFCARLSSNDVELSKDVLQFRDYYHADMADDSQMPRCDGRNAQEVLSRHHPWNYLERPLQQSPDIETIGRCIAYMVAIGFMPPPTLQAVEFKEHTRKLPSIVVGPCTSLAPARRSVISRRNAM